jgi:1,2-phenylacetyl-CoA epoxidase catalytic subunit
MNSVITNEDFLSEYPTYQNKGLNNITSGINSASITIDRITQGQALIKYNEELNTEENKYFIRQAYIYQTKVEIDRKYSTVGQTNYSFNGESASMSITQAEIDRMEQTVIQLLQNAGVLISNLTYGIDISKNEEVEQLPQEDDRYLTLLQDDPKYLKNVMPEDYDNKYIAYEKAPNEQFARAVYKDVPNPLGSNVVIKTLTFPVVNPISGNK